jgi:hypothetical protein
VALLLEAYGIADRPHVPPRGDPALATFKEWWHFNFIDDASGLDGIVNLSLTGDLHQADAGQANLILLTHERGIGWKGGLNLFDGLAARADAEMIDVALGPSSIRYEGGRFRLDLSGSGGTIAARLEFEPRAEPLMVWKDTPLGSGHINWIVMPFLAASGIVTVEGRAVALADARGYHDHNWGSWRWGENFGWDWGFCAAAVDGEGGPVSLVYDRTADRTGSRTMEHSLAIWRGERLAKLFTRRMIGARRSGRFVGPVKRLPGVMALIDPSQVTSVPRALAFRARDGADWLDARYETDAAIQIAIPRETGFGMVELNETLGWLTAAGHIGGDPISFRRRACFEFVG